MTRKNPNEDYSYSDRFQRFVTKLINFAIKSRSTSEIDNSPDNIFDGEKGELLAKFGDKIFYRKTDSNQFVNLSDEYREYMESKSDILNKGINKKVTWQKSSERGTKDWKFLGYFCPISDVDCCVTGSGDPQ